MITFLQIIWPIIWPGIRSAKVYHRNAQNLISAGALSSAPDSTEGAYSVPPDALAGFRGPTSRESGKRERGEWKGGRGQGKGNRGGRQKGGPSPDFELATGLDFPMVVSRCATSTLAATPLTINSRRCSIFADATDSAA